MREVRILSPEDYEPLCLPLIKRTMPVEVYNHAVEVLSKDHYSRVLFGLFDDDTLLSFSGYFNDKGRYWISWTATEPEHQGKGYCRGILQDNVFPTLRGHGASHVRVETYQHPMFYNAIIFYLKLGFKIQTIFPEYLEDGSSSIYLVRELND